MLSDQGLLQQYRPFSDLRSSSSIARSPMECGQLGYRQVGAAPGTRAPPAPSAQTGTFALLKGSAPAIAANPSATASRATPGGWGDRGGCLPSSRNGLQGATVLEQRCREPVAFADKPLDPPRSPDPPSREHREHLGGAATGGTGRRGRLSTNCAMLAAECRP